MLRDRLYMTWNKKSICYEKNKTRMSRGRSKQQRNSRQKKVSHQDLTPNQSPNQNQRLQRMMCIKHRLQKPPTTTSKKSKTSPPHKMKRQTVHNPMAQNHQRRQISFQRAYRISNDEDFRS